MTVLQSEVHVLRCAGCGCWGIERKDCPACGEVVDRSCSLCHVAPAGPDGFCARCVGVVGRD